MPQQQNAQLSNREGKIHHALSAYTTCQVQSLRRAAEVFLVPSFNINLSIQRDPTPP
jgi:hypothetical protein